MTHAIDQSTLNLARAFSEYRGKDDATRAAKRVPVEQIAAMGAALADLWEVASTAEALAKETLATLPADDAHLRMRSHAYNIIDEMKALAGEPILENDYE